MWDLIVSVPDHCLSFICLNTNVPSRFCLLTGLCEYLGTLLLQCDECLLHALIWNPKLSAL